LRVSLYPIHCVWPETYVTGRKAPADRIQPDVGSNAKNPHHLTAIVNNLRTI